VLTPVIKKKLTQYLVFLVPKSIHASGKSIAGHKFHPIVLPEPSTIKSKRNLMTPVKDSVYANDMSKTVILLTSEEHKDGVWITRLLHALSPQVETTSVVTLESLLQNFDPSAPLFPPSCSLIVNRVSDAAPPHLQKACVAVLQVAVSLQNMQVWNGPVSYGLCTNKWCHHVLFSKAGLSCPFTRAVLEPMATTLQVAIQNVGDSTSSDDALLLKPNAGGFGAGVQRIEGASLNQDVEEHASSYSDHMALIQEYVESDLQYRVWFLRGKVQCGIVKTREQDDFASACVANTCTRQPTARAIAIPDDVRNELEQGLLPLLPDAHAGSVEFLHDKAGRRLYFDLNLLSTLPLVERVQDAKSVWGKDFDPWKEMATAILDMTN
jgi:hypothetical protein